MKGEGGRSILINISISFQIKSLYRHPHHHSETPPSLTHPLLHNGSITIVICPMSSLAPFPYPFPFPSTLSFPSLPLPLFPSPLSTPWLLPTHAQPMASPASTTLVLARLTPNSCAPHCMTLDSRALVGGCGEVLGCVDSNMGGDDSATRGGRKGDLVIHALLLAVMSISGCLGIPHTGTENPDEVKGRIRVMKVESFPDHIVKSEYKGRSVLIHRMVQRQHERRDQIGISLEDRDLFATYIYIHTLRK